MNNWNKVKLGDVSNQIRGVSYKPADILDKDADNSTIILRANNIYEDKINYDELVFVKSNRVSEEQYLLKGDILICASSGSKHLVGKAACFNDSRKVSFGAFCKVIRPEGIYFEYLKHYFFSPTYRQLISAASEGANINNIRSEDLENLEIPLPPIETQKQIAATLDKVTKIISENKKLLEKYDLLIKSRFIEMFGDLSENSYNWSVATIADISTFLKSGLSRKLSNNDIGLPVIRSGNIQDGYFLYEDIKYWYIDDPQGANTADYFLDDGDILVNFINSASQIGKTAIFKDVGRKCIYTTNILRMKLSTNCNKYYYNWFALTDYYFSQLQRIIQPAVNQASFTTTNFLKLKIPVPPLELQQQFAAFVQQIDKSKFVVQKSLEKAETLYKSLMQEYFG